MNVTGEVFPLAPKVLNHLTVRKVSRGFERSTVDRISIPLYLKNISFWIVFDDFVYHRLDGIAI